MCKGVAWRGFWVVAVLLMFVAGAAFGQQLSPPSSPDDIAGNLAPAADASNPSAPQDGTPADASLDTPAQPPAETPADISVQTGGAGSADQFFPKLGDTGITELGTPYPLDPHPSGVKFGPFFLTDVTDSFFYAVNSAPGEPTSSLAGNSLAASIVSTKELGRGILAFQAKEQFSMSGSRPFYNQLLGLNFSDQLSERWTVDAGVSLIYFQNYILANPQYLLAFTNAGVVQQTVFAQQIGNTTYISNNFSASYSLSGRTQIGFTPVLSANFLNQPGGWSYVNNIGGGVSVTHSFSSDLSAGVFYNLTHSITGGAANTSPGWNSQSLGVNFHKTWGTLSVGGSLAASFQSVQLSSWAPTGNLNVSKAFRWNGSLYGAYSRSQAAQVFISSGYFDQGDIGYRQAFGKKTSFNVGGGEFRTVDVSNHAHGKRFGTSVSYQWRPRLAFNAGYNFAHQTGNQSTFFSGNTSYFSIGVNWLLGADNGQ